MTETRPARAKRKSSALRGALLFLALVVYFNLRSAQPTTMIDWVVMGLGATGVAITLLMRIRNSNGQLT